MRWFEVWPPRRPSTAAPAEAGSFENGYAGVAEDSDGGEGRSSCRETRAGFTPGKLEKLAAEFAVTKRTGRAASASEHGIGAAGEKRQRMNHHEARSRARG